MVSLQNFFYVTIASKGIQIFTYVWHSWPWSSEGSSVCHTYCALLWSSLRTHDTHTYYRVFGRETVTTCLWDLCLSRLRRVYPTFRVRGECPKLKPVENVDITMIGIWININKWLTDEIINITWRFPKSWYRYNE